MPLDIKSIFVLFAIFNVFLFVFFSGYQLFFKEKRAAIKVFILANAILSLQWIFFVLRPAFSSSFIIEVSNGLSFLGIAFSIYSIYIANDFLKRKYFLMIILVAIGCTIIHSFFVNKPEYIRIAVYSFISAGYFIFATIVFVSKCKMSRIYVVASTMFGILSVVFILRGFMALLVKSDLQLLNPHWVNQLISIIYFLVFYSEAILILLIINEKDQKQIQTDNEELQKVNATKNKILSVMAHDLRNHFNAILGFSSILKDDGFNLASKEGKQYINILNEQAEDTNSLLESLLTWSRSQSNQITYLPEYIDLNAITLETLEGMKNVANLKNITINFSLLGSDKIHADKNMLTTILRNLVSNSIKFTPSNGKIDVTILERLDSFEFSIKDNGVGLKKDTIQKLFTSEINASSVGTNNEKGTGLGLLLCKEFVEKHGGKIWVYSKPGTGSEFIFTIPKQG